VYSGASLLEDLTFQKFIRRYNFTRKGTDWPEVPIKLTYLVWKIWKGIPDSENVQLQQILALTSRYLATGDYYTRMQYGFQISKQTKNSPKRGYICSRLWSEHTGKNRVLSRSNYFSYKMDRLWYKKYVICLYLTIRKIQKPKTTVSELYFAID
jgi:hypothetical protein